MKHRTTLLMCLRANVGSMVSVFMLNWREIKNILFFSYLQADNYSECDSVKFFVKLNENSVKLKWKGTVCANWDYTVNLSRTLLASISTKTRNRNTKTGSMYIMFCFCTYVSLSWTNTCKHIIMYVCIWINGFLTAWSALYHYHMMTLCIQGKHSE